MVTKPKYLFYKQFPTIVGSSPPSLSLSIIRPNMASARGGALAEGLAVWWYQGVYLQTPYVCESGREHPLTPSVGDHGILEGRTSSSARPRCSQWSNGVGRDLANRWILCYSKGVQLYVGASADEIMFRVVEGQHGVTRVYRVSTNELVCTVKEKSTTSKTNGPPPPINGECGPRPVVERLPADCDGGEWPGAQAAVANYSKYCCSRGRLHALTLPSLPHPVVYRARQQHRYLGHQYSFNKRDRWKRMRELRTGLSRRALRQLDKCKDLRVMVRRLTPSEVALWTKGHMRLGRTPLRELPSFSRPVRCVLPDVVQLNGLKVAKRVRGVRDRRPRPGAPTLSQASSPLL
ncbi:hypothetical protein HPB51_002526 [Rhipicephalus microplus]|uniref:Uncharacterized protein n=1 Tax=Rhipicephalus microplus TaxID=6941 RepID=A0A9J6DF61_RHIMP|nr:hypothetical protein HPB51_002526 [Rhipicephalus microplus]